MLPSAGAAAGPQDTRFAHGRTARESPEKRAALSRGRGPPFVTGPKRTAASPSSADQGIERVVTGEYAVEPAEFVARTVT